ncbi:MAG: c-type cytochrome [Dehalococcoidia bacterium]
MKHKLVQLPTLANPGRHRWAGGYIFGLALLISIVAAAGCSQGSYPLDIFYEMHYQQSYKAHEPPRLSAPDTAVPYFPPQQNTSFTLDGQHLYEVNCSMCHGKGGKGDGPVLQRMIDTYGYTPAVSPDLTSAPVKAMGIAGVGGFMRSGLQVMPNFSKLLNDEEIEAIAAYVQTLQ